MAHLSDFNWTAQPQRQLQQEPADTIEDDTLADNFSIPFCKDSSMSSKNKTTTNNQAEYRGVVAGLAAAEAHAWSPIEVVGDSMLILRQLANYRSPRNARLFPLYAAARRSADRLGVTKWLHHLRAFNKMADHMANVAMDSQTSIQMCHPTTRLEHSNLQRLLTGDFQHWQVEASERLVSTW